MKSMNGERRFSPAKNAASTDRINTLPLMMDHKTHGYCKFSKILLFLQDPDRKFKRNLCKQMMQKFQQACEVYSDDSCNCERDHCDMDCYGSTKNRKVSTDDILRSCRNGVNVVVVNASQSNVDLLKQISYIAYQTRYCLLVEPPLKPHKISEAPTNVHESFGWHINETDSKCLREDACLYILDCLNHIPEFVETKAKYWEPTELLRHFHLDEDFWSQESLYCIANVCVYPGKTHLQYWNSSPAAKHYGKLDVLHVVGFVISPQFVAARVALNQKQKELWMMPENVSELASGKGAFTEKQKPREITVTPLTSKACQNTLRTMADSCYDRQMILADKGCTAHFLLGQSKRMSQQRIFMEIATVMERANNAIGNDLGDRGWNDIGKAYIKKFGKYWLFDLKEVVGVDAIFASLCVSIDKPSE